MPEESVSFVFENGNVCLKIESTMLVHDIKARAVSRGWFSKSEYTLGDTKGEIVATVDILPVHSLPQDIREKHVPRPLYDLILWIESGEWEKLITNTRADCGVERWELKHNKLPLVMEMSYWSYKPDICVKLEKGKPVNYSNSSLRIAISDAVQYVCKKREDLARSQEEQKLINAFDSLKEKE